MSEQTPEALASVVTAPYRDEAQLERAAKAARFYRALADAIEADPRLTPGLNLEGSSSASSTFYAPYEDERTFIAAARELPGAVLRIDGSWIKVDTKIDDVCVTFSAAGWKFSKRTVLREVEEYVVDEESLA